jgi:hypothetical protein
MSLQVSSQPDSGSSRTATIVFETWSDWLAVKISDFVILPFRVQHFILHLAPQSMVRFVLANGSMFSNQSGDCPARSASSKPKAKPQSLPRQRDIRRALIEADLVDCMVALPGQLYYSTQIRGKEFKSSSFHSCN